jgi:tRNA(Arg) A34 adenosine deaminase TadA
MAQEYQQAVRHKIALLLAEGLDEIERATALRRSRWYREQGRVAVPGSTARDAYELLFLDYIGVPLDQVALDVDTPERVAWSSRNPCDTLDACVELGLDTRDVCRHSYERGTQALLSCLDPQLRFGRSYRRIRPHADVCQEWIIRADFDALMGLAIAQARAAAVRGDAPDGAVVWLNGEVIAQAGDLVESDGDPTAHAEANAIRETCLNLGSHDLTGAVLVTTREPCPMCAALAVQTRMTSMIYGASMEELLSDRAVRIDLTAKELAERAPGWTEVIGGVRRHECLDLLRGES